MNYEEIQRLLAQNRQDIGKREAEIPGIYNKYSPSTDPEVAAARAAQADKVKQLFSYDSQLAQTKFQPTAAPGATVTGAPPETPPEMILDPLIGLKAANTQTMETANEAIDIGQNISKRKDVLAESLDKALKLFQVGLEIKKAEQASLQDEFTNLINLDKLALEREKQKGVGTGKEALGELFNRLTGLKQKVNVEAVPTSYKQGVTKAKGKDALKDIRKEYANQKKLHPNVQVDYSQKPDGTYTYNYFEPKKDQTYLTPEEYKLKTNPEEFLGTLLAGTTANLPKYSSEAEVIIKNLFPEYGTKETQYQGKEASREVLRQNIFNIPDNVDNNTALRQLVVNHPELTVSEIEEELYVLRPGK